MSFSWRYGNLPAVCAVCAEWSVCAVCAEWAVCAVCAEWAVIRVSSVVTFVASCTTRVT